MASGSVPHRRLTAPHIRTRRDRCSSYPSLVRSPHRRDPGGPKRARRPRRRRARSPRSAPVRRVRRCRPSRPSRFPPDGRPCERTCCWGNTRTRRPRGFGKPGKAIALGMPTTPKIERPGLGMHAVMGVRLGRRTIGGRPVAAVDVDGAPRESIGHALEDPQEPRMYEANARNPLTVREAHRDRVRRAEAPLDGATRGCAP